MMHTIAPPDTEAVETAAKNHRRLDETFQMQAIEDSDLFRECRLQYDAAGSLFTDTKEVDFIDPLFEAAQSLYHEGTALLNAAINFHMRTEIYHAVKHAVEIERARQGV